MSYFKIDADEFNRLEQSIKNFPGNAEEAINEVLHTKASQILQDEIRRLMPRSDVKPWKGKLPHAKDSKSLTDKQENLAITVKTTKRYQYLFFPDDGTSTTRHAGDQQFFYRGGKNKQTEIIDRCIARLVGEVDNL